MCAECEANSTDEIEITPEMIEAGEAAYAAHDRRFSGDHELVAKIFLAMLSAKNAPRKERF